MAAREFAKTLYIVKEWDNLGIERLVGYRLRPNVYAGTLMGVYELKRVVTARTPVAKKVKQA